MNNAQFSSLCTGLGLNGSGVMYSGVLQNWPLKLVFASNNLIKIYLSVEISGKKESLKSLKTEIGAWANAVFEPVLVLTVKLKKFAGEPADAINAALRAVNNAGFVPVAACPHCGRTGCDVAAHYKTEYRQAHRTCLNNAVTDAGTKAADNKENGNYLLGIIGALLGMIVGTIPTLLTLLFAEMEYAVLFALIPICAYYGYKLFKGRLNKTALIVTIVMAILGVFMIFFEMFVIYDIQEGMPASYFFADLVSYMMVGSNWGLIISSGVVEFIFAALGVWFSWRIISRTSVSGVEDAAAILELAVPYPQTPEYTAVDSGFDGYAPSGDYDSDKNSYKD